MIFILFIIWYFSFILSCYVMAKKGVEPNFYSIFFVLFPLLNTIIVINFFNVDFSDYKLVISELKSAFSNFKDVWKQLNKK